MWRSLPTRWRASGAAECKGGGAKPDESIEGFTLVLLEDVRVSSLVRQGKPLVRHLHFPLTRNMTRKGSQVQVLYRPPLLLHKSPGQGPSVSGKSKCSSGSLDPDGASV